MWFHVILILLCTSAFSDILILKTGDSLICNQYHEIFKYEQRLFMCNGDTIYPEEIFSKQNENGVFRFVNDAFLKKTINGRLSIFAGIEEKVVFEDINKGIGSPIFQYKKKKTPHIYYSFDDIILTKYNSIGSNPLLVNGIRENPEAFKYYRKYRTTQLVSIITANAFAVSFIIGMLKFDSGKEIVPITITAVTGISVSTCIALSVPKKLFHKAVACYNSE